MDISIIIPAFQETVRLGRLLKTIQDSVTTLPAGSVEVLVVDGGSKPPLGGALTEFNVRYFYVPHGGASAARNYGAAHAWGDAFFFLDSDTELLPDTLRKLLQVTRRSDFAVSSIPYHPTSLNSGVVSEFKALFDAYNVWHEVPRAPVQIINGSSVLFRRDVFGELGGWDATRCQSQCDHEEFSVRIKRRYPIVHEPDIFVAHNFPAHLQKLTTAIFSRTVSWTRGLIHKNVEFDGLTRTRRKALIALMPIVTVIGMVGGLLWPQLFWLVGVGLAGFLAGNADFFRFMSARAGMRRTISYAGVHFLFTLAVGAGAIAGVLSAWKTPVAVGAASLAGIPARPSHARQPR